MMAMSSQGMLVAMEVGLQVSHPPPQSQEELVGTTFLHDDNPNRTALRVQNILLADTYIKAHKLMSGVGERVNKCEEKCRRDKWGLGEKVVVVVGVRVGVEVGGGAKNLPKCPSHVKILSTKSRDMSCANNNPTHSFYFFIFKLGLSFPCQVIMRSFGIPFSASLLY